MRYNKRIQWILLLGLIIAGQANLQVYAQEKAEAVVSGIQFIPKEFNDIKLGYDETEMVKTSPGYPNDLIKINTMAINTPTKIYYNDCDSSFKPTIPLSTIYVISSQRALKYIHLIAKLIHVKNIKSGVEISGEICKKENPNISEYIIYGYDTSEYRREREEMIKKAQKLTDEEIDNRGKTIGDFINVNIMEYVDFPFLPGKYEVWLSFCGLESNHTIVEIVQRSNMK